MKKILLFVVLIFVHVANADMPDSLPIGSPEDLMASALKHVTYANAYGSATGVATDPDSDRSAHLIRKSGENIAELLQRLEEQRIRFRILDPENDRVTFGVRLGWLDPEGHQKSLFRGQRTTEMVRQVKGWELVKGARAVTVRLVAENVPVSVPKAVTGGYVRDDRGYYQGSVKVENGILLFPQRYEGRDYGLVLRYTDEGGNTRSVEYGISDDGDRISTAVVDGQVKVDIDNYLYYTDEAFSGGGTFSAHGFIGRWDTPPLIEVKLSRRQRVHFIAGVNLGNEKGPWHMAVGMWIRSMSEKEWEYIEFNDADLGVERLLKSGSYHIKYDYQYDFPTPGKG